MSSDRTDLGDQLLLETCVLRTLCLTVNADGSELKYKILDDVTAGEFRFPVTRAIFTAVSELHQEGDQVVAQSVEEIMSQRSVDIPVDFHIEDLFRGELPSMATLTAWMERLHSAHEPETSSSPDKSMATRARTHPALEPAAAPRESPPPPPPAPVESSRTDHGTIPLPAEKPEDRSAFEDLLSPESGHWLGFLAELTKKQGERLKTGFSRLDSEWGGLLPGLFLLAGSDRAQLVDFLKQLVDQIAIASRGPCLYLSFERSKSALRLQTLSRLSGASAAEIEKGAFGKDSTKWQDVVRAGETAVEWLQRIYVLETRAGLPVTRIRELRQGLLDSGAGAPRLVALDNLEKMASGSDLLQSVAELKELAEAFGIVVVGATTEMGLVHERSADMAASFHEENGSTVVKLSSPRLSQPAALRFHYHRGIHRFEESRSDQG